ncbi:MAG: hypothetical protein FWE53_01695 [Firmicutes bacterium]|nr:hypothetical protein [Bacillota bacterium]
MQQYVNKPISIAGVVAFLFALIVTPLMVFFVGNTLANEGIWDGSIASSFAGGNGTSANPYLISNGAQLAYLAQVVNANTNDTANGGRFNQSSKHYALTRSIALNNAAGWQGWNATTTGLNQWTPIGGNGFWANLDGRNNVITGLFIGSSPFQAGLFGDLRGSVSNLGVKQSFVSGSTVGMIAARNEGVINNCYNEGTVAGGHSGGIVGSNQNGGSAGRINNCYNKGTVTSDGVSGGIVAQGGEVLNSYNTGNVTATPIIISYVGGISGGVTNVLNCYNTGTITADGYAGGILGYTGQGSYIVNSYNTGNIIAAPRPDQPFVGATAGGIVGSMSSSTSAASMVLNCYNSGTITANTNGTRMAGGIAGVVFVGTSFSNIIANSYNTGAITGTGTGTAQLGGLIGRNDDGQALDYGYWLNTTAAAAIGNSTTSGAYTFNSTGGGLSVTIGGAVRTTLLSALNAYTNSPSQTAPAGTYYAKWINQVYPKLVPWLGQGTQLDPYLISNKGQLEFFRDVINSNISDPNGGMYNSNTKFYAMTNDIYLNDTTGWESWGNSTAGLSAWTPIGTDTNRFTANFDGKGFAVSGIWMYLNAASSAGGLFGYVNNANILNTGVEKSYISVGGSGSGAGGIAAHSFGTTTISGCYNRGTIIGSNPAGGIIGAANNSTIVNTCYNTGLITGTGGTGSYTGGIVGNLANSAQITNCYNTGLITANATNAGGIVGLNNSTVGVSNCYNTGTVTGTGTNIGGLVGDSRGPLASSYNVGAITGTATNRGGVAGIRPSGTISNCYYSSTAFSGSQIGNVTGTTGALTMSQMLATDTLTLYMVNMGNAWAKRINTATQSYYPELKVFATDLT